MKERQKIYLPIELQVKETSLSDADQIRLVIGHTDMWSGAWW